MLALLYRQQISADGMTSAATSHAAMIIGAAMSGVVMMTGPVMIGTVMTCVVMSPTVMTSVEKNHAVTTGAAMSRAVMSHADIGAVKSRAVMTPVGVMEVERGIAVVIVLPLPSLTSAARYAPSMVILPMSVGGDTKMTPMMMVTAMTRRCMLLPMGSTPTGTLTPVPPTTSLEL
jgi:hypothetical protein